MKKIRFKKWVVVILEVFNMISFIVLCSDCNNNKLFVITHFIALTVLVINLLLMKKYTDLFEEKEMQ